MFLIYFFIIIFVLIITTFLIVFNKLSKLKAMADEAWSGVDVQLNRRYSLIPNLVTTVKAYAQKEKEILESVTELRSKAMETSQVSESINYNTKIDSKLNNILLIAEAYPEIKSNNNFLSLQHELVEVEDQIQLSRRYYNGSVRNYNIAASVFPNKIIAKIFNFKLLPYFEAEEKAKEHNTISL